MCLLQPSVRIFIFCLYYESYEPNSSSVFLFLGIEIDILDRQSMNDIFPIHTAFLPSSFLEHPHPSLQLRSLGGPEISPLVSPSANDIECWTLYKDTEIVLY